MSGQRQKNRPGPEVLAFPVEGSSEAPKTIGKGTETLMAKCKSESLAGTERQEVCELGNSMQALQRVKSNGSGPERGSASFANGVSVRIWRRKPPAVLRARGDSRIRPAEGERSFPLCRLSRAEEPSGVAGTPRASGWGNGSYEDPPSHRQQCDKLSSDVIAALSDAVCRRR
jgi:hypothetical protein